MNVNIVNKMEYSEIYNNVIKDVLSLSGVLKAKNTQLPLIPKYIEEMQKQELTSNKN